MHDNNLLKQLRAGDEAAFRLLVESEQDRVVSICYRYLNDLEDARDLAQEVFIEVHRSVTRFRGQASISTWLYRIAISKSLDLLRRRGRKKRTAIREDIASLLARGIEPQAEKGSRPDEQLLQEERMAVLQAAMRSLPANQHTALTLHKLEGMSHSEVANIMGNSISAVEALIHRGKRRLAKQLNEIIRGNIN
jgi:RNA polymerase sigma-70 factor (ECF subfamily)